MHFSPQIWEENGGASYSPNVAYLAVGRGGGVHGGAGFFFSCSPPLKPRCILWPSVSSSPKNRVFIYFTIDEHWGSLQLSSFGYYQYSYYEHSHICLFF